MLCFVSNFSSKLQTFFFTSKHEETIFTSLLNAFLVHEKKKKSSNRKRDKYINNFSCPLKPVRDLNSVYPHTYVFNILMVSLERCCHIQALSSIKT